MKTLIPKKNIDHLAQVSQSYCYSSYVPLKESNSKYGRKLLKGNIEKLKEILVSQDIDGQRLNNFINPLQRLVDDKLIWQNDSKSLVVFLNESEYHYFFISKEVEYSTHLNSNFHLLPLFENQPKTPLNYDDQKIIKNRIEKIIPLAYEDKIDTLYVSSDNGIYGVYDSPNNTIIIDEKKNQSSTSLLNLLAVKTYLNGAHIYLLDAKKVQKQGVFVQAILK